MSEKLEKLFSYQTWKDEDGRHHLFTADDREISTQERLTFTGHGFIVASRCWRDHYTNEHEHTHVIHEYDPDFYEVVGTWQALAEKTETQLTTQTQEH